MLMDQSQDETNRLPEFEARLAENWPIAKWCDTHVVLAVSGGGG